MGLLDGLWHEISNGVNYLKNNPKAANSLIGFGQGLAQAGAPSRLPISFGQGVNMGFANVNPYLQQHAKTQAQEMQNAFMRSRLGFINSVMGHGSQSAPTAGNEGALNSGASSFVNPSADTSFGFGNAGGGANGENAITAGYNEQASVPNTPAPSGHGTSSIFGTGPTGQALSDLYQRGLMFNLMGLKGGSEMMSSALSQSPLLQQRKAMATDAVSLDLANERAAEQQGNQTEANMWHNKAMYDTDLRHFSTWNGMTVDTNPAGKVNYMFDSTKGIQYSPQSGMQLVPNTLNVQGQLEHAKSYGEGMGRAQTTPRTAIVNGKPTMVPESFYLHGGIPGNSGGMTTTPLNANGTPERSTASPTDLQNGDMLQSDYTPGQKRFQEGVAKTASDQIEEYRVWKNDIPKELTKLNEAESSLNAITTGNFANVKSDLMGWTNSAAHMFGLPGVHQDELNNYQAAQKTLLQVFMEGMKDNTRGQERASMFTMFKKAFPALSMQKGALGMIMSGMKGIKNYKLDMAQEGTTAPNSDSYQHVQGFQNHWTKTQLPMSYAFDAMMKDGYAQGAAKWLAHTSDNTALQVLQGMVNAGHGDTASALVQSLPQTMQKRINKALTKNGGYYWNRSF